MKVLHTKAVTEPILLTTTCHNMNLFAIVTRSLVVVYRSTTLTVVTTLTLSLKDNETAVSACWSPSGRLLAIGLQCGEVYLLDVESGDLVRRFVPRSGIALAIRAANAPLHSEDDVAAAFDGGDENNDNSDDKGVDPLQKPPIVPISVEGAIVACTWTSAAPRAAVMNSHKELCLPLRATVSSPILEELEREIETPVMLLLDQKGGLSFLPGGLQEVCVVVVNLPWPLEPQGMRVEAFVVAPPPSTEMSNDDDKNNSKDDDYDYDGGGGGSSRNNKKKNRSRDGAGSHTAYLVVQDVVARGSRRALSQVVRIHLSDTVTSVTARETVAICCISEYCRMGKVSYRHAWRRWRGLIQTIRRHLLLPKNVMLLRDALVEDIARPMSGELLAYFRELDLAVLAKNAEELSRQFAHLVVQVSNVAYRCYDIALHLSQVYSSDRQRQCLLMDVISSLRQRCSNFMRQMRLEVDREKELVQWVVQRASILTNSVPPVTELFAAQAPLRASRHPSLLRTLHRIWHGKSTTSLFVAKCSSQDDKREEGVNYNNNDDDDGGEEEEEEEELPHFVQECLFGSRETLSYVVPFLDAASDDGDYSDSILLQRQCEVLVTDAAVEDGVQVHAVTVAEAHPSQPLIVTYALETRGDAGIALVAQQEHVAVETEPLKLIMTGATLLWCGKVDEEGRILLLWERTAAAPGSERALVLSLMDENGTPEMHAADDEDKDGDGALAADEAGNEHYAVLEIKGISTRHLRVSASRARGFVVIYAKERFVVVDIYSG